MTQVYWFLVTTVARVMKMGITFYHGSWNVVSAVVISIPKVATVTIAQVIGQGILGLFDGASGAASQGTQGGSIHWRKKFWRLLLRSWLLSLLSRLCPSHTV